MPVQFIGGSGGGSTDVRETFAAPVLNDALANTTTIVAQYQIPANYLTLNDMLNIKYIAQTGNANSGFTNINFYIGNTGTLADTKINIEPFTGYYRIGVVSGTFNYLNIFLDSHIYFTAVGSSGLATARFDGHYKTSAVMGDASRLKGIPLNFATVDTTQPVYISLVVTTPSTMVIDTLGSYISVGH